jgi:hypothetical protein
MREFFHEKLQLPVEFFNPLRNVQVASNLNLEEIGKNAHTLGEMVGLALRGALACPMEINLRPASVVRQHQIAEKRPYLILATVCLWAILAGFFVYYSKAKSATEDALGPVEGRVASLQGADNKINQVKAAMKKQEDVAEPLTKAVSDREAWPRLFNEIENSLPPEYVWITSLQEEATPANQPATPPPKPGQAPAGPKPKTYLVKGLYLENPNGPKVVDEFVDKLNQSTWIEVNKDPKHFKRTTPSDTEWAYDFSFPIVIKDKAASQPDKTKKAGKS